MPRRTDILMVVYNDLLTDGRARRAAEALSEEWDVELLGLRPAPEAAEYTCRAERLIGRGPLALAVFGCQVIFRALQLRPRVVYAHDYFLAGPGWIAARLTGSRLVVDTHELLVAVKLKDLTTRDRVFLAVEKFVARRADLVVAANSPRARIMKVSHGLANRPTVVKNIPRLTTPCRLAKPPASNGPIRLMYQGVISDSRGLEGFVRLAQDAGGRIALTMIGDGEARCRLEQIMSFEGASRSVTFTGRIPPSAVREHLSNAAIGLLSYPSEDLNNHYCAPNKIYEYAQQGVPMVGIGSRHLRQLIEGHGLGRVLDSPCGRPELAATVEQVLRDWSNHHNACLRFAACNEWSQQAARLRASLKQALAATPKA